MGVNILKLRITLWGYNLHQMLGLTHGSALDKTIWTFETVGDKF